VPHLKLIVTPPGLLNKFAPEIRSIKQSFYQSCSESPMTGSAEEICGSKAATTMAESPNGNNKTSV
jgi:hypothetical protein